MKKANKKSSGFDKFASVICKATGSSPAFIIALSVVLIWAISGPFFDFSETWQLVINTGTTIITFLMVFLIQKAQNKDSLAIQLKLNELVASNEYSSNRLVDIESMTEEEMETVKKYYAKLSLLAQKEESIHSSHSLDEAEDLHEFKTKKQASQDKEKKGTSKKNETAKAIK